MAEMTHLVAKAITPPVYSHSSQRMNAALDLLIDYLVEMEKSVGVGKGEKKCLELCKQPAGQSIQSPDESVALFTAM